MAPRKILRLTQHGDVPASSGTVRSEVPAVKRPEEVAQGEATAQEAGVPPETGDVLGRQDLSASPEVGQAILSEEAVAAYQAELARQLEGETVPISEEVGTLPGSGRTVAPAELSSAATATAATVE